MSSSSRLIVTILIVTALAIAFWMLALSPKRKQADELGSQVAQLHVSLEKARSKVAEAVAARRDFPADYRQLVDLGPAVPASDETASLLVELDQIAARSKVKFDSIQLNSSGETAATEAATATTGAATPPTEAAASLLPLGASIGPAGLDVMPYDLTFTGNFFHVADFIRGIDSLVHTGGSRLAVGGRLVTLDGFALNANAEHGFPDLEATFAVTTYLTPPSQGVTAGATPAAPAPSTATPAADTSSSGAATSESSKPASAAQ